jgi:epoxyqueuosine reductase QueG
MEISEKLKERLLEKGAALVGYADLRELPADIRDEAPYGVSIVAALEPAIVERIKEGPAKEYYREYLRVNELLATLAEEARGFLAYEGYEAISKAPTYVGIDPKTRSTILPHKTVATRAGVGWIGKCALLVTEQYGSAIRLTTVLTDAPVQVGRPVIESKCGECLVCVEACPGKAPSGENWGIGKYRDEFFNADKCAEAAWNNAVTRIGVMDTICGVCVAVCPWTRRYILK